LLIPRAGEWPGAREGGRGSYLWRAEMHYLPKPIPEPIVGFVNTRCPKCQRVTSYLSFRVTPLITCAWTNCGYTWFESADQCVDDQDESGIP
jgi:hypothetical protein